MFCKKASAKIKALLKGFNSAIEQHIDLALQVTTALKQVLKGPVGEILTAIIPGQVDDMIRAKLIQGLDKAIEALSIVDACKGQLTLEAKVRCFAEELARRDPQLQDAILQKLASLLTSELDGKRLKQAMYDLYTQGKYTTAK